MKIEIIAFTPRGCGLGQTLEQQLSSKGHTAAFSFGTGEHKVSLPPWTKNAFASADVLIFVGAAGIAVRACAPHIVSKVSDPAVLVLDEAGEYCIPLLSGHIGGANAFAKQVAELIGAKAVITTATDVSGLWAVDSWAVSQSLMIVNPEKIKCVSARLLAEQQVLVCCRVPVSGELPRGVCITNDLAACHVLISPMAEDAPHALQLVPLVAVLGLGCRKETAKAQIEEAFQGALAQTGLHPAAFGLACSIDLKANEQGILEFCADRKIPYKTFPMHELAAVAGEFSVSGFVKSVTGVDNVCERSAVLGSHGGKLLLKKQAENGVTTAVAIKEITVHFNTY